MDGQENLRADFFPHPVLWLADSNSVANSTAVWCLAPADQFGKQAVEGLIRRGVVECLPGPIVEAGGDQVELALVQPRQGAAFRQVLAQQAVGVLVGPRLIKTMQVGKQDAPASL